ncbi:MAG: aminotransferase class I/II-fold pyridoxal phosphate-dependent enzyme, partial [Chloroflexi bacterium]|nr:aminotransferase class I/II-fold pyridoxal phosphate-dependent enzyme [Chloroflexota bacterium]
MPLNPLGSPPAVVRALANLDISLAVDPPYSELREALGARLTVPKSKVWVSGSVTELVFLLARATLHPRQRALLFRPGPPEYVEAVLLAGGEVVQAASTAQKDWRWELRAVREILRGVRPEMTCVGSPNDPTGAYLASEEVEALARAVFPAPLLVDESYVAFADTPWESASLVNEHPNLIILRSPIVDYALAGVSLAYCIALEEIVERLRRLQG